MNEFMEVIGQLLFDNNITKQTNSEIYNILKLIPDSYTIVDWPEVQELMEEDWFQDEAILNNSDNAPSSQYFIPLKRIK